MVKKIGIIGDGVAGRTLAHVLNRTGVEVELFGRKHWNACGIRGCGWGTSGFCIDTLVKMGLYPGEFILRHDRFIELDGRRVKGNLYAINKPRLLHELYADVKYDKPDIDNYDLVVDATGLSRELLPPAPDDKLARNYQYRAVTRDRVFPAFDVIRDGYLWTIPLGDREAHIGGGSTSLALGEIKRLVEDRIEKYRGEVICGCCEPIRLSGLILPVMNDRVVAVGESAGVVVPFGGGGIHSSIEAALMLAQSIVNNNIDEYNRAMKTKFGWLRGARKIIDNLSCVSLFSLPIAYRTLTYQGMKPNISDLLYIRKRLMEVNHGKYQVC